MPVLAHSASSVLVASLLLITDGLFKFMRSSTLSTTTAHQFSVKRASIFLKMDFNFSVL